MPSVVDLTFLRSRAALTRIAIVTAICAGGGLLYGLLAPRWYRSMITLAPAKSQKAGGLAGLLGGDLGSVAAGLDSTLGGGADSARIAAVLQGTAVTDAVIERFDLKARYGTKYQEVAREALWDHCSVKTLQKPNLVQVSCEDKDPRFVQGLLNFLAENGNEVFRRVNVSSASEEVRYLEKRVRELRQAAEDSASRMRAFQEKHKIVDLDSQAKALVSSVAALNAERLSRRMELGYARGFSSPDEPRARQLESQLSVVNESLRELEGLPGEGPSPLPAAASAKAGSPGMFPPALAVPALRAEYEGLVRDRRVAETTLLLSLDRLEGARASEARDVSTFVVLDSPPLPTRRARPRLLDTTLAGSFIGFAASMAFAYWRWWTGARRPTA